MGLHKPLHHFNATTPCTCRVVRFEVDRHLIHALLGGLSVIPLQAIIQPQNNWLLKCYCANVLDGRREYMEHDKAFSFFLL